MTHRHAQISDPPSRVLAVLTHVIFEVRYSLIFSPGNKALFTIFLDILV